MSTSCVFSTRCGLNTCADIVDSLWVARGLDVTHQSSSARTRITGGRYYGIARIRIALPVQIQVNMVKADSVTRIELRNLYAPWYRGALTILAPLALILWVFCFWRYQQDQRRAHAELYAILVTLMAGLTAILILVPWDFSLQRLAIEMRHRFQQIGFPLERSDSHMASASAIATLVYATAWIGLFVGCVLWHRGGSQFLQPELAGALILLAAVLGLVYLLLRSPEADVRIGALLPTLGVMLSLFIHQAGVVWSSALPSWYHQEWNDLADKGREIAVQTTVMGLGGWVASGITFVASVRLTSAARALGREQLRWRRDPGTRAASKPRRALPWIRLAFGGVGVLFSTSTFVLAGLCGFGVFATLTHIESNWAKSLPFLAQRAVGLEHGLVADLVAILVGAFAAAPTMILLSLSVFGFVNDQFRLRKAIASPQSPSAVDRRVLAMVSKASAAAGMPVPPVALCRDLETRGRCAANAVWASGRVGIVEIDPALASIGILTDDELYAVIAHELAHVRNGDPQRVLVTRAIARVLLLGDPFVVATIDTLSMERAADLACVTVFHGDRAALARARRIIGALPRGRRASVAAAFAPAQDSSEWLEGAGRRFRFIDDIKEWWALYTGSAVVGYWHPTSESPTRPSPSNPTLMEHTK